MKKAKTLFWRKYKIAFGVMLFVLSMFAASAFIDDPVISLSLSVVLPIVWISKGKFTEELTENEVKKLNAEDLAVYIKEYNESRINTIEADFAKKLGNLIPKSEFKKLQESLKKINEKAADNLELKIKEFEMLAEKIAGRIEKSKIEVGNKNLSSFEIHLIDTKISGSETKLIDKVKNFTKDSNKFTFQVKATFVTGDVATITANIGNQRLSGIGQIAGAKLVLSSFFNSSPIQPDTNGNVVYEDWDEATTVEAAAAIAEGANFPANTAKFKTYAMKIEKVGTTIAMTYEAMNDFTRFTRELARFLTRNIQKVVNQALWNGSGVTPNIGGIYTVVTAFNAAGYAGVKTTTPNLLDLLVILKKQIMNAQDDKYDVNFAFCSHEEYLALEIAKDSTGRLLYPLGVPARSGVELIPTSFVVDNTAVIGDRDFVELIGDPDAVAITVGEAAGDWIADRVSLKGRVRSALLIRNADLDGFLKVTSVSAAITAITV